MAERTFEEAAADVKTLTTDPGNDAKLRLYGLYKIGSGEDIAKSEAPGMFDFKAKAKRNAWQQLLEEGFTQESAQKEYIRYVEELVGPKE